MIVMIDDDRDDFDIIEEAVRTVKPGAKMVYFDDPEKSLTELPKIKPQPRVILLDINMPRMNGFQFLHAFRQIEAMSEIPVIVMSTTKVDSEKIECLKSGAAEFITKPACWKEMLQTAKYILEVEQGILKVC